jgi:hypothetical protein
MSTCMLENASRKPRQKLLKVLRTVGVSPMVRLAIADRVPGAHCIDDFPAALVPELLEPLADQTAYVNAF